MFVSADTVNTFKNSLDNLWFNQKELYEFRADLRGMENRNIVMHVYHIVVF